MEVRIILSTLTQSSQIDVLYDLEGSGTDFTALANLWTISSLKNSNKRVYTCAGTDLLGGYNIMGGTSGQYLKRTYTGLPAHNQISLVFTFWPIDSWDKGDNDHINVAIDDIQVTGWAISFNTATASPTCGNTQYDDLPPMQIHFQVAHEGADGSSVTIKVINNCNEASDNESTGIRNVVLAFETVASPSQEFCSSSTDSALPSYYTICSCSESQYMTPAGSGSCYDCNDICETCTGPNTNQCLSCADGKYLSGSSSKTCGACDSSCATCDGPLDTDCLTCNSGDYYVDGQCVTYCNEPFYSEVVGANTVCETPCPGQFVWKDDSCTDTCSSPYTSVITTDSLKACVCFNVVAPGQDCYTCDPSCSTCDGQQASQCVTCFDRFYLAVIDDDDDVDGTCESCDSSCLTCSGPSDQECLSCDPGLFLFNGTCASCDPSCLTCDGPSPNECLTCGFHLYLTSDNSCNSCDDSCGECTGPSENQCETCNDPNYLYNNNTCIASCDSPFLITEDATNKYCDTPCLNSYATEDGNCVSACDALSTSSELYDLKACYCNSPNYRYWNNSCLSNCDSPLEFATSGLYNHCACPYYLYKNNTCITSCNSPFYITQDSKNKYCDTTCPGSFVTNDGSCSSVCDGLAVHYALYGLKSCYCNSPNYRYWNGSCLSTCTFPLQSRTSNSLNYCDFPCASNEYLYFNQSCSRICPLPYVPWGVAGNLYCRDLGCTSMKVTFLKETATGYEYSLKLSPSKCDLPAYYMEDMLNDNQDAIKYLVDFNFVVTRTAAATYLLDLTLGASVLQETALNLNLTGLTGQVIVFTKLTASSLAQKLVTMAASAGTIVSVGTVTSLVSILALKSTASVWGFVGFQQLMNYLKYINVAYPFQIQMFFKLGGATEFGDLPNLIDTLTNSSYTTLASNADLLQTQDPPYKFQSYDESSIFIKQGGSLILFNLLLLPLLILFYLLRTKTKIGQSKILTYIEGTLRWGFVLRSFLTSSLPFIVSIFLQLRTINFQEEYLTLSSSLAIFALVYFVIMTLFILFLICSTPAHKFKEKKIEKVYGTLVVNPEIESSSAKYYDIILLLRNVLFAAMLVFVEAIPLAQILSLVIFNVLFVFYIHKKIRFEHPKETRKTIITEALLIPIGVLISLLLVKNQSENYYEILGWVITGIIAVIFVNEIIFVIQVEIETIKKLWGKARKFLKNRKAKKQMKYLKDPIDSPVTTLKTASTLNTDNSLMPKSRKLKKRPVSIHSPTNLVRHNKEKARPLIKSDFKSPQLLSEINGPPESEDLASKQESLSLSQVPPDSYVSFTNCFTNPSEDLHLTEKNLIDSVIEDLEEINIHQLTSEVFDFSPENIKKNLDSSPLAKIL